MTALTFPGQVSDEPGAPVGGCELGGGRCVYPAELQVTVPATGATRKLCREHVGWYLMAASAEYCATLVRVRRVSTSEISWQYSTVL